MTRRLILPMVFFLMVLLVVAGCVDETPPVETNSSPGPDGGNVSPGTTALPLSPTPGPEQSLPPGVVPVPSLLPGSTKLTTIAVITGQSGISTKNITVPSSSWELWYTADPQVTGGQDSRSSTGSSSAVFPCLSIQVTDSRSGETVGTVEPPGGLDSYLWQRAGDPRPWSQKFFQGHRAYSLIITAKRLKSYTIEIRVPK